MFGITKQRLSKVLYTTLLLLPVCLSLFAVLYHIGQYYQNHPDTLKPCLFQRCLLLEAPFRKILYNNDGVLFLLEPYLLMSIVAEHLNSYEDMEEFKWRFDLPMEFEWRRNSLTVGVFAEHLDSIQIPRNVYIRRRRILGLRSPFAPLYDPLTTVHLVYHLKPSSTLGPALHLHVVVFHRVQHFFWLAQLPPDTLFELTDDSHYGPQASLTLHYCRTEQIFDPFSLTTVGGISVPDDLMWFLGQLPSSRYLHCDRKKILWLTENNIAGNAARVQYSDEAFRSFKGLMRQMMMPFWMACGTLLGWYRQCHITPYTTDTDFATWGRYLKGRDLTESFRQNAPAHNLLLSIRFGEPSHTQEFAFYGVLDPATPIQESTVREKIDLFFYYGNGSHYQAPLHFQPEISFNVYPLMELCSGAHLGYKLLVPCDPERIVEAEYGPYWDTPTLDDDYFLDEAHNILPFSPFPYGDVCNQSFYFPPFEG